MKYKYKNPMNDYEVGEVLHLVEDRGDRVLVKSSHAMDDRDWAIVPTFCISKSELVESATITD